MRNETGPFVGRRALPSSLYAILDPGQTTGGSPIQLLRELLAGGARLIQLRAKEASSREFLSLAREARRLCRAAGSLCIVNDRLDVALASEADGVHLGQEDLPLAVARRLLGPQRLVGISTHDLAQAEEAERGGADYIGFGPLFGTATKDTGYSPRGVAMLREIRRAVKIPIVAIGGITEENVARAWDAGADAAAIIGDLMRAGEPAEKVRRILSLRAAP